MVSAGLLVTPHDVLGKKNKENMMGTTLIKVFIGMVLTIVVINAVIAPANLVIWSLVALVSLMVSVGLIAAQIVLHGLVIIDGIPSKGV